LCRVVAVKVCKVLRAGFYFTFNVRFDIVRL